MAEISEGSEAPLVVERLREENEDDEDAEEPKLDGGIVGGILTASLDVVATLLG